MILVPRNSICLKHLDWWAACFAWAKDFTLSIAKSISHAAGRRIFITGPTEQINMELWCAAGCTGAAALPMETEWYHHCKVCEHRIPDSLGEKSSSASCMPETNGTQFLNFPQSLEMKIGKPPGVIRNHPKRMEPVGGCRSRTCWLRS